MLHEKTKCEDALIALLQVSRRLWSHCSESGVFTLLFCLA